MTTGGLYIVWVSDTHYYGGRTKCFEGRWAEHLRLLKAGRHGNPRMQNVFNIHGRFEPEIVLRLEPGSQIEAERAWLLENHRKPGCLNLSRHAHGAGEMSGTARDRLSRSKRRDILSAETLLRMSEAQKGKKLSAETKEKIRQARARQILSEETREKLRAARLGSSHSDETKAKISSSQVGKVMPKGAIDKATASRKANFTEATRLRMSEAQRGKKMSEEARSNMATAQRARRLREKA